MRNVLMALCAAAFSIIDGAPSSSQEASWIVGKDDRVRVQEHGVPWDAIGQINIVFSKWLFRCSGVLIAPNVVLTAAHCLINPWSEKPFPPGQVNFASGVHLSTAKGRARGRCIHFAEGYMYSRQPRPSIRPPTTYIGSFRRDVAVIVLDREIPVSPAPLAALGATTLGMPLLHAGYPEDRRHDLTAHDNCRILSHDTQMDLWKTDCDSNRGSDGGPVFAKINGTFSVAGIMAAGSIERTYTVVVPILQLQDLADNRQCP